MPGAKVKRLKLSRDLAVAWTNVAAAAGMKPVERLRSLLSLGKVAEKLRKLP